MEDKKDVYKGNSNEEFKKMIIDILENRVPVLTWNGRERAVERDVRNQARKLNGYYEQLKAMGK